MTDMIDAIAEELSISYKTRSEMLCEIIKKALSDDDLESLLWDTVDIVEDDIAKYAEQLGICPDGTDCEPDPATIDEARFEEMRVESL